LAGGLNDLRHHHDFLSGFLAGFIPVLLIIWVLNGLGFLNRLQPWATIGISALFAAAVFLFN